ncbi:hypothetical protein UT300016_23300 [Clostridium senegalense]
MNIWLAADSETRFVLDVHLIKSRTSDTEHIPVEPMSSDINNNLIESFNKTFKVWYKAKRGFNSFEKANTLIYLLN